MSEKKKENKVQRTKGELLQETYRQLKFLKQECACYDAGDWDYGRQIAVKLRVLLHDTGMSHSVLRQLTEQFVFNRPDFLDLSTVKGDLPKQGQTRFVRCSLCQYMLDHRPDSPAVLTAQPLRPEAGKHYPLRAFPFWWEKLRIIAVDERNFFSRKEVVEVLANTDGGAHVDPEILEKLALLNRRKALPLRICVALPGGGQKEYTAQIDQILGAAVRTIAEETLFVFERDVLPRCGGVEQAQ